MDFKDKAMLTVGVGLVAGLGAAALMKNKKLPDIEPPSDPPPGEANLYGYVVNKKTGTPVANVTVTLKQDEAELETVETDNDGIYYFSEILPGEYDLLVSKDGFIEEVFGATLAEGNNQVDIMLTPVPVAPSRGILMWYGQLGGMPGYGGGSYATVWDARLYDIEHEEWLSGVPSGIKDLDVPAEFRNLSTQYFLIKGMTQTFPGPAEWSALHLVKITQFTEYAWTPQGLLGADEDRNLQGMEAEITGRVGSVSYSEEDNDAIVIRPVEVLSGDPAFAYIDQIVWYGSLSAGIKNNDLIRCTVSYDGPNAAQDFSITAITMAPAYPPEAYIFNGNLFQTDYSQGSWLVTANTSGNISPFAVHAEIINDYNYPVQGIDFQGPGSYSFRVAEGYRVFLYAHPNPSQSFNRETWRLYNWVRVNSLSL